MRDDKSISEIQEVKDWIEQNLVIGKEAVKLGPAQEAIIEHFFFHFGETEEEARRVLFIESRRSKDKFLRQAFRFIEELYDDSIPDSPGVFLGEERHEDQDYVEALRTRQRRSQLRGRCR